MRNGPIYLFTKFIYKPARRLKKKTLGKINPTKILGKITNFLYSKSSNVALIMTLGDAISIFSSHTQQINGLKKSDRENKDILITQEKTERILDLLLTIAPPIAINRWIKKIFESGRVTTRDFEDKLKHVVGPGAGVHRKEFWKIDHIRPIKEEFFSLCLDMSTEIANKKKLPEPLKNCFKKISNFFKSKLPDMSKIIPNVSLQTITTRFDDLGSNIGKTTKKMLKNGSAYDELQGFVNGMSIIGVIGYSILASNVIMPFLRNKISSYLTDKKLKEMGETRESIKRKKRYAHTNITSLSTPNSIFNDFKVGSTTPFTNINSKTENIIQPNKKEDPFAIFNTYSKISSQSTGLRI